MLLLAPFAPHLAEELWGQLGHASTLAYEPWPPLRPDAGEADELELPVQVNGKLRHRFRASTELDRRRSWLRRRPGHK